MIINTLQFCKIYLRLLDVKKVIFNELLSFVKVMYCAYGLQPSAVILLILCLNKRCFFTYTLYYVHNKMPIVVLHTCS